MAAATAWDELATELNSTAASYSSVISGLTGEEWLGPRRRRWRPQPRPMRRG